MSGHIDETSVWSQKTDNERKQEEDEVLKKEEDRIINRIHRKEKGQAAVDPEAEKKEREVNEQKAREEAARIKLEARMKKVRLQ